MFNCLYLLLKIEIQSSSILKLLNSDKKYFRSDVELFTLYLVLKKEAIKKTNLKNQKSKKKPKK